MHPLISPGSVLAPIGSPLNALALQDKAVNLLWVDEGPEKGVTGPWIKKADFEKLQTKLSAK